MQFVCIVSSSQFRAVCILVLHCMKMKKRSSSASAAPFKKTKALHKQVDGEIFVPVREPRKCCCLCGQNNKDVRLGQTEPPDSAKDQQVEIEEEVPLLVCYICYHSVHKYLPGMTVREVLEHSLACGHVPGGLNRFFQRISPCQRIH